MTRNVKTPINRVMSFRRDIAILITLVGVFVFTPSQGFGRKLSNLPQRTFLFYAAGNLALTSSEADKISGATYVENMRTPLLGTVGLGAFVKSWLWLGARYENWFSHRDFSISGVSQEDKLYLQQAGPEIGYVRGNPRVSYLFVVGALYPFEQRVVSTANGSFSRGTRFWNYYARASMELRLTSRLDFHLESGYRWVNLKDLKAHGTSFLPGGSDLNLSGPFIGAGLGLRF